MEVARAARGAGVCVCARVAICTTILITSSAEFGSNARVASRDSSRAGRTGRRARNTPVSRDVENEAAVAHKRASTPDRVGGHAVSFGNNFAGVSAGNTGVSTCSAAGPAIRVAACACSCVVPVTNGVAGVAAACRTA